MEDNWPCNHVNYAKELILSEVSTILVFAFGFIVDRLLQLDNYRTNSQASVNHSVSPEQDNTTFANSNLIRRLFGETSGLSTANRTTLPTVEEEFKGYCHATGWPRIETVDIIQWWDVRQISTHICCYH